VRCLSNHIFFCGHNNKSLSVCADVDAKNVSVYVAYQSYTDKNDRSKNFLCQFIRNLL